MHFRTWSTLFAITATCLYASPASAQYALFDQTTDTILVSGNTVLDTTATYEARVFLTDANGGLYFNEYQNGAEDKQLGIKADMVFGYSYNLPGNEVTANTPVALNVWHHVAYVYDGTQERLYLDGTLLTTRANSGNIRNSDGSVAFVGAINRDGSIVPSFLGLIDTLRISNSVRYSGNSFNAPTGDLIADANTQLLYNFNESPGSTTVTDLSGNGNNGAFGIGFGGATSPQIVPGPGALVTTFVGTAPGICLLLCRRSRKG